MEMEFQLSNDELYNAFKKLQDENYHLKRQLINKNKTISEKDRFIKKLLKEAKEWKPEKHHYKNGKRGTNKNGG